MCLLDEVLEWSDTAIRCQTSSHRAADNPLRAHGRLGAVCGIEYAAQAMAIHRALLAPTNAAPGRGLLLSVRAVCMHAPRLDAATGELLVSASYQHADAAIAQYVFSVGTANQLLVEGRAVVMPDAGVLTP
jgi:predicted hotdog family 3-hydroxylacyl-ACP dehydratase